jgi:hypothetical protein
MTPTQFSKSRRGAAYLREGADLFEMLDRVNQVKEAGLPSLAKVNAQVSPFFQR